MCEISRNVHHRLSSCVMSPDRHRPCKRIYTCTTYCTGNTVYRSVGIYSRSRRARFLSCVCCSCCCLGHALARPHHITAAVNHHAGSSWPAAVVGWFIQQAVSCCWALAAGLASHSYPRIIFFKSSFPVVFNSDGRTLLGFGLYSAIFNYSYSKSWI